MMSEEQIREHAGATGEFYRITIEPTTDLSADNANVFTWTVGIYEGATRIRAVAAGKSTTKEYAIEQAQQALARDRDDNSYHMEDIPV